MIAAGCAGGESSGTRSWFVSACVQSFYSAGFSDVAPGAAEQACGCMWDRWRARGYSEAEIRAFGKIDDAPTPDVMNDVRECTSEAFGSDALTATTS